MAATGSSSDDFFSTYLSSRSSAWGYTAGAASSSADEPEADSTLPLTPEQIDEALAPPMSPTPEQLERARREWERDAMRLPEAPDFSSIQEVPGASSVPPATVLVVAAHKCPECKALVYSRARHDMRSCPCGAISVDGGFDYVKLSYKADIEPEDIKAEYIELTTTRRKLFKDWSEKIDLLGIVLPSGEA